MSLQALIIAAVCIFIVYRIVQRVRRTIGWQQLNPGKMRTVTVILSVIGLIFLAQGALHLVSIVSDGIGLMIGVVLAYYGAEMTRFERRGADLFYRTNIWIGSVVTALFLGRLAYRVYGMYAMSQSGGLQQGGGMMDSLRQMSGGWTSGFMLIMFAYYIAYNLILLRKQKYAASRA
ncbi:hypothetical protein N0M98_17490 [Paenibacillus doosanensis]|uniref:hypothetical protein n=1 Tax=Paenibacillus doosanensis TaxID=1229154 RepID=UPI002180578B|nr:hypothetical protein [Paenibacillus doosanensis]MCS7461934.1 hypothetical protein [Paenibacillus doosanensis]